MSSDGKVSGQSTEARDAESRLHAMMLVLHHQLYEPPWCPVCGLAMFADLDDKRLRRCTKHPDQVIRI